MANVTECTWGGQERAARVCERRQAERRRMEGAAAAASEGSAGAANAPHSYSGTLPVFQIPGLSISLPSTLGPIQFSPLFLTKEQLHLTWVCVTYH